MTAPALSEQEARALVDEFNAVVKRADQTVKQTVRAAFADVRPIVKRFIDGRGWKALGYATWGECAPKEFEYSRGHLHRLAKAAELEAELIEGAKAGAVEMALVAGIELVASPIGDKDEQRAIEGQLRQLNDPRLRQEVRTLAAQAAMNAGRLPTASDVAQAVETVTTQARDADREAVMACRWALVKQRMNEGRLKPFQARAWADALDALDKQPVLRSKMLQYEVTDPKVIRALAERARRGSETLNEVLAAGSFQFKDGTFVPLGKATVANVDSFFAEVGREKRAAGMELHANHVVWTGEFIAAGEAGVILTPPGSAELIAQLAAVPKGTRITIELTVNSLDAKGVA